MKNSCCFILCYALLVGNFIGSRASDTDDYLVMAKCKERTNVSTDQIREVETTKEGMMKLINGEGDFKDYSCYLACGLQEQGMMTGNVIDFDLLKVEFEQLQIDNEDVKSRYNEITETCASSVAETDDECDVALSYHICGLKIMNDF